MKQMQQDYMAQIQAFHQEAQILQASVAKDRADNDTYFQQRLAEINREQEGHRATLQLQAQEHQNRLAELETQFQAELKVQKEKMEVRRRLPLHPLLTVNR